VPADLLTRRELNRATLERQLLLRRSDLPVLDAVEHLVGLQAQEPQDPYTALWSRLDGFRPEELSNLLERREVVRSALMRSTIHLVSGEDCLLLRPLMQPVLDAELARYRDLRGVDVDAVLAFGRKWLEERPLNGTELRAALAERFPGHDAADLAYACRNLIPLVQVPPRGLWKRSGQVRTTPAESWLGRPVVAGPSLGDVVLRYFAVFGPAAVADVAAWSRLTGLREVVERLRPRLRSFRDERGRELFDLPDALRPDPETPAPVRFLPEYDNVLLSFADRGRFLSVQRRTPLSAVEGRIMGTVLHDGFLFGVWQLQRDRESGTATVLVSHVERLTRRAEQSVGVEGRRFLRFVADDASSHDLRFVALA